MLDEFKRGVGKQHDSKSPWLHFSIAKPGTESGNAAFHASKPQLVRDWLAIRKARTQVPVLIRRLPHIQAAYPTTKPVCARQTTQGFRLGKRSRAIKKHCFDLPNPLERGPYRDKKGLFHAFQEFYHAGAAGGRGHGCPG
jgi:hypothetical protein